MKLKQNESGRSMVEMLGVLAIIGVLSVGGIAGYTIAMRSYKANEIINATSMLFMKGLASNVGEGTEQMDLDSNMLPSGCGSIHYNGDKATLDVNIEDETICKQVKTKLGDKAGDCTAATGGATGYTLTVTLGEASGGITSSPWYKADCSADKAPCVGNGYRCFFGSCYCDNGAGNPPDCNDSNAVAECGGDTDEAGWTSTYLCTGKFVTCSSYLCYCNDSSENYPNCTKTAKCLENGTCFVRDSGGYSIECFDSSATPPDCTSVNPSNPSNPDPDDSHEEEPVDCFDTYGTDCFSAVVDSSTPPACISAKTCECDTSYCLCTDRTKKFPNC